MAEKAMGTPERLVFASPLRWLVAALCTMGLVLAVFAGDGGSKEAMPTIAKIFMIGWLAIAAAAMIAITGKSIVAGFLIALLAFLIGWRIAGLYSVDWVRFPLIATFLGFVALFFDTARRNIRSPKLGPAADATRLSITDWHLTLFRLYVGLNIVPHFTEKLFAGPGPFQEDVAAFTKLGVPAPELFVYLGGACEFGIAVGVGLGLVTRFAAVGAALYMMIATLIGDHFSLGFIWASPGGGWEYPVLWAVLLISFAFTGGGRFSLDHVILQRVQLPKWIKLLMVRGG